MTHTEAGFPKTLAALRDQEDRSWAVADALVDEIAVYPHSGDVVRGEFVRCQEWLANQGYPVTADYLASMRRTAMKFTKAGSEPGRVWNVPFRAYMAAAGSAAWTPDLMDRAERESWTLRQFSEALTGKPWSDDDREAAKRILRDPEKLREVTEELEPGEARDAAITLRSRAWKDAGSPTPPPSPKSPPLPDDSKVRDAERNARERELTAEEERERILGGSEILSDLATYRDRGDQFIERWSKRRIRLTPAERGAFDTEIAALMRVVDQIRYLGQGHASPEDELRQMEQEHKR